MIISFQRFCKSLSPRSSKHCIFLGIWHILAPSDEHHLPMAMTGRGKTGRSDSENWNENSNPPAPPLQVSSRARCISFCRIWSFIQMGRIVAEKQINPTLPKSYQPVFWASNTFKTASSSWAQLNAEAEVPLKPRHPMPYGFSSSIYQ